MNTDTANPRVSLLLQGATATEVIVLIASGIGLLVLPNVISEIWPWSLTPFNAAFLGAVYTSSLVTAALLVLIGRWSPARIIAPMILLFTAIVFAVSVAYLERFRLGSPFTWLWFALYLAIPVNAAWHLWLYRKQSPADPARLHGMLLGVLPGCAALFGFYGLGLLIAPQTFSAFWPWPIDAFHGRLYSVAFLTPALGAWLLTRSAGWAEILTMALTLLTGGVLSIAALVLTDLRENRVNWAATGTWAWIGLFGIMVLTGLALLQALRTRQRPAGQLAESALIIPMRETALVLGVAFTAAGIGGFLPVFTLAMPQNAPALCVSSSYGLLLGLFPVNAVHSLFHLAVGLLGLGAYLYPVWSRTYIRGFAVALSTLTLMGLLPGLKTAFGLAPLFGHDIWLHGIEAIAAIYIGFVMPDSGSEPVESREMAAAE